jgi:hypothetical protein
LATISAFNILPEKIEHPGQNSMEMLILRSRHQLEVILTIFVMSFDHTTYYKIEVKHLPENFSIV